ncbi:MAG: hypothetical protein ACYTGQ_02475 [Planctomycetota bacterium]|jgi:hypothetical protein
MASITLKTNRFGWLLSKLGFHRPVRLDVHTGESVAASAPMNTQTTPTVEVVESEAMTVATSPVEPASTGPLTSELPPAPATVFVTEDASEILNPELSRRESGGRGGDNNDGDNDNSRDARAENLNEVAGLIRGVRGQLNRQSDRSQRIIELMQSIPESIGALPEINRNQKRLVEAINTQLTLDERHHAELTRSLKSLTDICERQAQMMGLMQQRMDLSQQTDAKVVGGLKAMNQVLRQVGESGLTQSQTLRELLEQRRVSDMRLEQMVAEQTRTNRTMLIANWTLAAAALGLAVWALVG